VIEDVFKEAGWRTWPPNKFIAPQSIYNMQWYVQVRHPGRHKYDDNATIWMIEKGMLFVAGSDEEHRKFAIEVLESAGLGPYIQRFSTRGKVTR